VVPAGLAEMLGTLRDRYSGELPPIYITENGCSQPDVLAADGSVADPGRIEYLDGHLRAIHDAMDAGVDVRGYFQWTLTDNFEWSEGYHQRFGLIYLNLDTLERIPKASFHWYRNLIASQRFS
jgi:beta-glucosidase